MPHPITVLVVTRDTPDALARLLALCHRRGWRPVSLRCICDDARCEVTMRLAVQADRRGTEAQVREQIGRLVGTLAVAVDAGRGLPDEVAFTAVRQRLAYAPASTCASTRSATSATGTVVTTSTVAPRRSSGSTVST